MRLLVIFCLLLPTSEGHQTKKLKPLCLGSVTLETACQPGCSQGPRFGLMLEKAETFVLPRCLFLNHGYGSETFLM